MRVRHTKPLPSCFAAHPKAKGIRVVLERDLRLTPRGKLRAKLLVFERPRDLLAFWRDVLRAPGLGRHTLAAVNQLALQRTTFYRDGTERSVMETDPRYFCLIGLARQHLSMEVIAHESVHAGYAYAKRRMGNPWCPKDDMDEETVAYPAGRVAAAINRVLHDAGLYQP